jgi:hypothetical protein
MHKLPEQDPFFADVTQGMDSSQRSQATPKAKHKKLKLPPGVESADVTYRYEVNPAMALSLLSDIQTQVIDLQKMLRSLVGQIQAVYAEGPVVEGWLESAKVAPNPEATLREETPSLDRALLRHADVDDLMAYVQALEVSTSDDSTDLPAQDSQTPLYRLCRLDESGQVLSRPCPPEQVAIVSMAIARHQKLTHLVEQRLVIEDKLKWLVNALRGMKQTLMESSSE